MPIPTIITEEWLNDLRRRVLAEDPPSHEELRAAREHIRQRHVAAGSAPRSKKAEVVPSVPSELDNW